MSNNLRAKKFFAENEVESDFMRSACAIMIGAGITAFGQRFLGTAWIAGSDLQLIGLSLGALVLNLQSWRRFVEIVGGNSHSMRAFVFLKIAALALLVTVLVIGRLRGLLVFFLCLVLFLFGGGLFILRRGRGN